MTDREFEDKFLEIAAFVKRKLENAGGCHDFDHTQRVLTNALLLADKLPEADRRVVRMASLLHDVARPEEAATKGRKCHAVLGSELAASLLREAGFDESFADRVAAAVLTHRFRAGRIPTTPEARIVYDADKLDSLGAVGLGRAFLFAGRVQAKLHNKASEAVGSPAYSREDTAYREYLVKLRHIPGGMLTAPGRRLARSRARFMRTFFRRLNEETGLNL